ncbi:hypothetical protein [Tenacibaculum jejuense]|nr:hypothetical protein [Tenacibaculum jejuense]
MKKHIIFTVVSLLSFNISFSQIDSISLPKGGIDTFDFKKKHHSIYFTKDNEVFFNKKRIRFWDQLSSSILEEEREPKFNAVNDIVIYADKKSHYYDLQRIKSEIGKVWEGFFHYKSDSFTNNKCISIYVKNSYLKNKTIGKGYDIYFDKEIIYTKNESLNSDIQPPKLKAIAESNTFFVWQTYFSEIIFNNNIKTIKEYLSKIDYATTSINHFSFDPLDPKEHNFELQKLINDKEVIFLEVTYSISYGAYFKGLSKIHKRRYKDLSHGDLKKPFLLEIPTPYIEYLKDNGLDLFKSE